MSPGVEPERAAFQDGEDLDEDESGNEDESDEDLADAAPRGAEAAFADEEGPGTDFRPLVDAAARPGLARFDPAAWTDSVPPPSGDGRSWRLVVRRGLYDHGTMVQSSASLAPLAGAQELRLGPEAMDRLGVEPGDEVRVRTPRGELVLAAVADAGVPGGVALLQFNAAPAHETSASALIDASVAVVEVDLEKVV